MRLIPNRPRLTRLALVVALLAALVVTFGTVGQATAQATGGKIRFVHALPGAPAVDVYVDGTLAARALEYGTSTRFLNVAPGARTLQISATGTTDALFQANTTISPDFGQTIVVQGTTAALEVGVYEDDLAPTQPGNIRITAIHAIKDAPPVDLLLVDGQNILPLIQGLSYGQPYGAVDIAAAAADLVVVPAGADPASAVLRADRVSLVAGTYNSIIALGTLGGSVQPSALALTVPTQAGPGSALVRLVHASPNSPAVDVYAGDTLIAPNLTFGAFTPHVALPAGSASLAVRVAGAPRDSAPVLTGTVDLAADSAATVAVTGPTDNLTVVVSPDNITSLPSNTARVHLVNATSGSTARGVLSDSQAVSSEDTQGLDLPAGNYNLAFEVDGESVNGSASLVLAGGVLYDLILINDANVPLVVATTGLSEAPGSLPAASAPEAAAVSPTETPAAPPAVETTAPVEATPTVTAAAVLPTAAPVEPSAPTPTPAVFLPTVAPTAVVQQPTAAIATAAPIAPAATVTPFGQSGITAQVDTDPGVNLKLREYPITDARTLALVPSGTTLRVDGVKGPARNAAEPTPQETATLSAEGVSIQDLWVFVTWNLADGGTITGWTKPEFLVITNERGKRVTDVAEILAFPQIPENEFGEITSGLATPIAADQNFILGTVNVDPGVNLQLRRTPGIDGESLALLPAGAQLVVLQKTEVPSQGGLIGEPQSTVWLFARFSAETGSITGWVNSQFITLTRQGRPFDIAEVPEAGEVQRGGVVGSPAVTQPPPPAGDAIIATIDKVDPGANLHLRRNPDPAAESLALIPANTQLPVLGRNGDGLWLLVRFGEQEGWINVNFVSVTRRGRSFPLTDLENRSEQTDTILTPTVEPTATPG